MALETLKVVNTANPDETMTVNVEDIDEIVYSQQRVNFMLRRGRRYFNPMFYVKPIPTLKRVFIVGSYPKIVADYRSLNIEVVVIAESEAMKDPKPEHVKDPREKAERIEKAVPIPEKYTEMGWDELRELANKVSDVPVVNRKQAIEIIMKVEADRAPEPEPAKAKPKKRAARKPRTTKPRSPRRKKTAE